MTPTKSAFGLLFALLPILYVGGLLWYFVDFTGGSFAFAGDIGLGPTMIGLAVVGLLLFIPLIWRMMKVIQGPGAGGSGTGGPRKPGPSDDDDNGGFDADAVIAKYLAGRSDKLDSGSQTARGTGVDQPQAFGRRNS